MSRYRFEENLDTRYVGVDDGSFELERSKGYARPKAVLAAVLLEGIKIVAFRIGRITVDGLDATAILNQLLKGLKFDAIFLSGVSFAGFNLVDAYETYGAYREPVIIVTGRRPNNRSVKEALRLHFKDWQTRWAIIRKLGVVHQVRSCASEPPLFFEVVGTSVSEARRLIKDSARLGRLPEPVRVAGLVAKGLSASLDSAVLLGEGG
jgi:endonuclease V-like protein UPF0215 family